MAPAFSSRRQAFAFALCLVLLMILPVLLDKTGNRDRRDVYSTVPRRNGAFAWFQQKVFSESSDVDIAFIGASLIQTGIETPYVQKEMSRHLGREAEVFTIGCPWDGFDAPYIFARDLLNHRRVRVLVIDNVSKPVDRPHSMASRWFRLGEDFDALEGLSFVVHVRYYATVVLGSPRQLLSRLRPNLLRDPVLYEGNRPEYRNHQQQPPNTVQSLGGNSVPLGYRFSLKFERYVPQNGAQPSDALIYSPRNRESFEFTGPPLQASQLHFARKLAQLCEERGTHLVILHMPSLLEFGKAKIPESVFWPDALQAPIDIVGISPNRFFDGFTEGDAKKLYYEKKHLNTNGREYFTRIITPALLHIYDSSNKTP
jgi:hypothetical protein